MSAGPGGMLPEGSELIIDKVQRQLQRIYEIDTEHSVSEFLVTDAALVSQIEGGQPGTRDIQEKLLVRQDGEEIDVALYVERDVLTRLTQADPTQKLNRENLADYLVLLEGVSHFLYLDWNATHERPVTLLELELQAEVDKFVSSVFWIGAQEKGRVPRNLGSVLFDDVDYDEQLDADGRERYETANRAAMKYCQTLEERFLTQRRVRDMVGDLRRFWRLRQEEKLRAAS